MVGSLVPAGVRENVKDICAEVVRAAAAASKPVRNVWGYAASPDHNNRRCVDYMVTSKARGDYVAAYNWTHRKRFGVRLIIWNRRIRRTYRKGLIPAGVWARYSGPSPHTDHPHVEYQEGDYRPPSEGSIPDYVVDAAKVDTWLWEIGRDGKNWAKRRPGYRVKNGVTWHRQDGRRWLVTSRGTRFAADYLRRA